MRNFLTLLSSVLLLFFLLSCKKSNNNTPQALIVGKWTFQNASYTDYRNDTLIVSSQYKNCNCSVQFNKDGTFSDFYNVTGDFAKDTTSGNYSIAGNTLSFAITSDRGYVGGLVIPTPVAIFIGGAITELNVSTNLDQVTQLTSSKLSVHAVVTSLASGLYINKVVVDETYTR